MPFIGKQPDSGGYQILDAMTASATASYTMQINSTNFEPGSANQLIVSLNGVIQKPGSSFTISGSTLTFSSALTSSDSIDFIISMGEPLLIGTPSDATVTGNKLASNIGISTTGNIATTGSGTLSVAGNTTLSGTAAITGKITSTAGITFGSDTAAANVLHDYEEGTWTPAYTASGGGTISMGTRAGFYVKIGKTCFCHFHLRSTGVSGVSGSIYISGFPFPASGGGRTARGGGQFWYARDWGADMPEFRFGIVGNQTYASLYRHAMNSSASAVTTSQFATGGDHNVIEASITYEVEE